MMKDLQRNVNASIQDAYDAAANTWTGWNWTQSFGQLADCDYCRGLSSCGGQIVVEPGDDDLEPPHAACEHYRDALAKAGKYAAACLDAAAQAEEYAAYAMSLLRAGDRDAARVAIETACRIERDYGDCPTWGPVRDAIESH